MTQTFTTETVKHFLGYPFRDARWQYKFLLGSLVLLANFIIPILPSLLLLGYVSQIVYRIVEGDGEFHLPEWSDLGKLLSDGFRVFAATFVYSLPMVLLFMLGFFVMFVPLFFIPLAEQSSSGEAFAVMMIISQFVFFAMFGVAMFFGILYYIVSPAMIVHTIARQKFSAAFEIGTWFNILKKNFWGFFAALIIMAGIYTALMYAVQVTYMTLICCWLIPILLMPVSLYMLLISYALMAEAYKIGKAKLSE